MDIIIIIFQFLLLISVIGLILFTSHTDTENFDAKINRVPNDKCGVICTKTLGCQGFASNPESNTCFLSKSQILGKPEHSLFGNKYNSIGLVCNKFKPVTDTVIATTEDLINNSIYSCSLNRTSGNTDPVQFRQYVNSEILFGTNKPDISKISVDDYTFEEINWDSEINLDDRKDLIKNPTISNSITVLKEKDGFFAGEYLYSHGCSGNIDKQTCLKQCILNSDCAGTEWNPVFLEKDDKSNQTLLYRGICCPKKNITTESERNPDHEFGKFYLKTKIYRNEQKDSDVYTSF